MMRDLLEYVLLAITNPLIVPGSWLVWLCLFLVAGAATAFVAKLQKV